MEKINLSFLMYGGLSYGGAHKMGINLAKSLDKNMFCVRYFWCRPAIDKFSSFKHPTIDLNFLDDLKKNGVEMVEFHVGYRDISKKNHPWFETDFFEVFNLHKTDLIFSVRAGQAEFPIMHINKPFIEWNVFGGMDDSDNLVCSVAHSPWVKEQYLQRGGCESKSFLCFPGINIPETTENLRKNFDIDKDTLVLGFHQRADDAICGEQALKAWKKVQVLSNKKLEFFILGGSEKYKKIAEDLYIKVHFLPVATDSVFVSKFLNTLDIYTHSGKMGETLGMAIEEAMVHKLPVVAMLGKYNGHVDVIGDVLPVAGNFEGYVESLTKLINDDIFRHKVSELNFNRAQKLFSYKSTELYFENLFTKVHNDYCGENTKTFVAVPLDIYDRLDIRSFIYRIFYRFPYLLNFVLSVRNKILVIINNYTYGHR